MERMDVARDPAVKMKGEDLAHAYDAVRVANKSVHRSLTHSFLLMYQLVLPLILYDCLYLVDEFFDPVLSLPLVCVRFLESQLRSQRGQWEEELEALRCQLSQAISGSSSTSQRQVLTY